MSLFKNWTNLVNENYFFLILFFLYLPFLLIQYFSTKPTDFLQQTEIEGVEQIFRMHQYPPFAYRLANIIEARPEFRIYFRLEKNFLNIFDLSTLFNNYRILLLPFFLIGYFEILRIKPRQLIFLTLLPIILLTIIGHQNLYGPVCLYPIIYSSILFGFIKIVKR